MNDLIDRQKCIEEILAWCVNLNDPKMLVKDDVIGLIKMMPSAQPEIVQCKDCKFYDGRPCGIVDWYNAADDFCSRAERRTGE